MALLRAPVLHVPPIVKLRTRENLIHKTRINQIFKTSSALSQIRDKNAFKDNYKNRPKKLARCAHYATDNQTPFEEWAEAGGRGLGVGGRRRAYKTSLGDR